MNLSAFTMTLAAGSVATGLIASPGHAGCPSSEGQMAMTASYRQGKDIVDTAVSAGSFKTLAAALQVAGLVDALKSNGPFTVFAPTDEAFSRLPAGTVQGLLKPENRHQLIEILKYHVVPGRIYASDALQAESAETVQGSRVRFSLTGNGLMVNGASIVQPDIETSNGVIHVIDEVILPS